MSGSYGALNQKYNTLYSLYLQLQGEISGANTLQEVLDEGNTATGVPIILNDTNYTNTIDKMSVIATNADNNKVQMICAAGAGITNSTTTILADKINMANNNLLRMRYKQNGIETYNGQVLDITTNDSMTLQGLSSTEGQVITADALGKPTWATLPSQTIPTLQAVLDEGNTADAVSIMLTDIDSEATYSSTGININNTNEYITTISPSQIEVTDITTSSTTIMPNKIEIVSSVNDNTMTIVNDNIQYGNVNNNSKITINKEQLILKDDAGLENSLTMAVGLLTTDSNGDYVSMNYSQGININGDVGSVGKVLTKGATSMSWATPAFIPTADQDLNMNSNDINNIASLNAISATDMNINGQAVFNTPPHMPDPILGNDGATKGYVDQLIGNYSGNGLTLYFNYTTTQTDPIIAPSVGALQQTLAPVDSPTTDNYYTMRSVALGTDTLISTFTTDVNYPNTLTIPTGLWSMIIWGYSTGTGGQLYYHFHLNEVNSAGAFVAQIGTSGFSSDVNAVSSADPDAYHASLALVAPYTMASVSNRLQIQIYTTGTGAVPTYLYTLFGGDYYSNVTSTLNGATSLLTQNNTWSGVNNFTAGFLTNGVDSEVAGTLNLGTTNSTLTTIGSTINPTTIRGSDLTLYAGGAGTSGQILTKGTTYATWQDAHASTWVDTATSALNMEDYAINFNDTINTVTNTITPSDMTINFDDGSTQFTNTITTDGITFKINGNDVAGYNYQGIAMQNGTLPNNLLITQDSVKLSNATKSIEITQSQIKVDGSQGSANQVFTKNGANNVTWSNPAFVPTATQALNMGIYGITGSSMDSAVAGTLSLGTTNATTTTLGRSAVGTTSNLNGKTINIGDATSTLNLEGLSCNFNGTTNTFGDIIATDITTSFIDSATSLNLGTTTATDINIGSAGTTLTADIEATTITLTGDVKATDIDSATTLGIGDATATTLTLGRSANTATNIAGTAIGLTGTTSTTITAPTINVANATGATSTINILNGGATTAGSVNIASVGANSTNVTIGSSTGTGVVNILGGAGNSVNIANGAGARTITIGNTTNVLQLANVQLNNNLISGATSFTNTGANIVFGSSGRESTMNGNVVISSASGTFTMGLNKHINLNSANTALPTLNQLGYVVREAVQSGTMSGTINTFTTLATYASIPAGTWLFVITFYLNASGIDSATFSISSTTSENQWANTGMSTKPASGNYGQVSGMITITAATSSVYLLGSCSTASASITQIRATRTRIA